MEAERMTGRAHPILRAAASIMAQAALVLSLSLAIVWPLWRLATTDRRAYTVVVGASACLSLLALIARAIRARTRRTAS